MEIQRSKNTGQEPLSVDTHVFFPLVFVFPQNVHKALMKGIFFSIPRRKMKAGDIGLNLRD